MKIVRLTKDMHPWRGGQDAVLPDDLAAKVIASGEASDPRPYPPPDVAPAVPVGTKTLTLPRRGYQTRKRG